MGYVHLSPSVVVNRHIKFMEAMMSNEVTTFAADAIYLRWTRPSRGEGTELRGAVLQKRVKFTENVRQRAQKGMLRAAACITRLQSSKNTGNTGLQRAVIQLKAQVRPAPVIAHSQTSYHRITESQNSQGWNYQHKHWKFVFGFFFPSH